MRHFRSGPTREQFCGGNFQAAGNYTDVLQTNVSGTALDAAHVTAVETDAVREVLLTPPPAFAKLADALAEQGFYVDLIHMKIVTLDDSVSTAYKYTVFKYQSVAEAVMKSTQRVFSPSSKRRSGDKTFCEFFAGIGLVREGLEPSGWSCGYANDIDPKKRQAYVARFGPSDHFHLGDVGETDEVARRVPGRPFLATASFPCIDLSVAGHYRGLVDGFHSSTFFGFVKLLDALGDQKPPVVMVENVPGFLTSRRGEDFAIAARRLADLGYWLDAIVLDASHFTPQSRPRVFLFGMDADLKPKERPQSGWLWPPDEISPLRPSRIRDFKAKLELSTGWVTVPLPRPPERTERLADAIDADDGQPWWDEADVRRHYDMMSDRHRHQVEGIVQSGTRWVGTIFRRIREGAMRAEVRFDGLAGCLRTPKGGSAKQIVIAIDRGKLRMRWMTPREYARLQGTPDFPLVGTTNQQLWGFADAVCVPAIRWIDLHVLTPLYDSAASTQLTGGDPRHTFVRK